MFFNQQPKVEISSLDDLIIDLEEYKKIREKILMDFKIKKVQENVANKLSGKISNTKDLLFPEDKNLVEFISDDFETPQQNNNNVIIDNDISTESHDAEDSSESFILPSNEKKKVRVVGNVDEETVLNDEFDLKIDNYKNEDSFDFKKNKE
ncbi:hypothetical protein H312_00417 [Anncaliia algerae PRA339]|uniref:Uncharacterized protein n=1 Tax=Anncaliia algerae PRA339 TaxID=1288291 RepID=A0A059F4N1_9MICR|nr:hypothetical protein H312_00417 [Anncaliia algerae PRA339]